MRRSFFLLCAFTFGCTSPGLQRKYSSVLEHPFTVESRGYPLNGQINHVPGSDTVALFFHGSGIHDRWEMMPAELTLDGKPAHIFKVISEEPNKKCISTAVYDKRGFREKGTQNADTAAKTAYL